MSFGKNTITSKPRVHSTGGSAASIHDLRAAVQPQQGPGNLPWIVAGALLCVATFAAPFAWSYMSSATSRLPYDAAYLPKDPVPTARRLPVDERPKLAFTGLGLDIGITFPANATATGFDPIDTWLHDRCVRPLSKREEAASRNGRVVSLEVENGSNFLACSMQHQVSRFCQPEYRQRLAKRLRIMLRAQEMRAIAKAQMRANPIGQQMSDIFAEVSAEMDLHAAGTKNGKPVPGRRITSGEAGSFIGVGPGLGKKLTEFSRVGLLTSADFGLAGVPSAVHPFMTAQEIRVCPNG